MRGIIADHVVLWTSGRLQCPFCRRVSGPPFEITLRDGSQLLTCAAFEHDEDAAAFAVAEMHKVEQAVLPSPLDIGHSNEAVLGDDR